MQILDWSLQIVVFVAILTGLAFALGTYFFKIYDNQQLPNLGSMTKGESVPLTYWALFGQWITFIVVSMVFLIGLQLLQNYLPLNPEKCGTIHLDHAFLNAAAVVSNTGWFHPSADASFSYLTRLGFSAQALISASFSLAVAVYLINSLTNSYRMNSLWFYFRRSLIFLFLPLAVILATINLSQGVPNNYRAGLQVNTLENESLTIPQGPIATHIGAKYISSNGGGWFVAGAAHPFENPTAFTDYLHCLSQLILVVALPFYFGLTMKNLRLAWLLLGVMLILYCLGLGLFYFELNGFNDLKQIGLINGENLLGKEVRFGTFSTVISMYNATISASGAFNGLINYFSAWGSLLLMTNLVFNTISFGGAGIGFINLLFFLIITLFLVGQMSGRSLNLFGKKIDLSDLKWLMVALCFPSVLVLVVSAFEIFHSTSNLSAHQLSTTLYRWFSLVLNNGSFLGNLDLSSPVWNLVSAICCLLGHSLTIGVALYFAGAFQRKTYGVKVVDYHWNNVTFLMFFVSVILIIEGLAYFPALVCGPIFEVLKAGF